MSSKSLTILYPFPAGFFPRCCYGLGSPRHPGAGLNILHCTIETSRYFCGAIRMVTGSPRHGHRADLRLWKLRSLRVVGRAVGGTVDPSGRGKRLAHGRSGGVKSTIHSGRPVRSFGPSLPLGEEQGCRMPDGYPRMGRGRVMSGVSGGAPRWLRWVSVSLVTVIVFLTATMDYADARKRKRGYYRTAYKAKVYRPKQKVRHDITLGARYAAFVLDGNTGKALHEASPDKLRHPASLTKVMTLYLLFELLEAGKLKLNTPLQVSEHASIQSPTKLGLRAGQTIEVEDAIKALVTRSANDAAVVIAEAVAGDEQEFAKLMTRKARALGMSQTVYKNASGLPDSEQVTTARDQAVLGLAVQERFPKYYRYFATTSFEYRGASIRNHNRLLGRVEGVDGIKTGYTRASGFNLITSMRRSGRHIVAVVLGGSSGGERDARMRTLIESHIKPAAPKKPGTAVAAAPEPAPAGPRAARFAVASAPAPKPTPAAAPVPKTAPAPAPKAEAAPPQLRFAVAAASATRPADPVPTAVVAPAPVAVVTPVATTVMPEPGSTDPITPVLVKTLTVRPGMFKTASLTPSSPTYPAPAEQPAPQPAPVPAAKAEPVPQPAPAPAAKAEPPPPGARPGILGVLPAKVLEAAPVTEVAPTPRAAEPTARVAPRNGWIIQIGAFPEEGAAKQQLSKASRLVGSAEAYTEPVVKGEKTLYRARFAGFSDKDQAEAACKQLKRSDMTCMATRH